MVTGRQLVDRVRDVLAAGAPVREVRMFGGLSFMVNDKMVVSVRDDGLLLRVDPARADELLAAGARPADVGAGRVMSKGWISVSAAAVAADEGLNLWISVALEYNREAGTRSRGRTRRGG